MILFQESLHQLQDTLPLDNQPRIIYEVQVELEKNDIIQVTSKFQTTTSFKYPVMVGSYLAILDGIYQTQIAYIDEPDSENITADMHHLVKYHMRQKKNYDFEGLYYIALMAYAASDWGKPEQSLIVNNGYGHLDVTIHRGD